MKSVEQPAISMRLFLERQGRVFAKGKLILPKMKLTHLTLIQKGSEANFFAQGANFAHQTRIFWKEHPKCVDFKQCIYLITEFQVSYIA